MRIEVLGGVERRRRWSRDDKMRIIEETLAPGAVVTEIARRHGIATSLVFTWRRRARLATATSAGPRLVPVQVAAAAAENLRTIEAPAAIPARKRRGLIEIELVTASASALTRMSTPRRWGGSSMF
jgi:transposase